VLRTEDDCHLLKLTRETIRNHSADQTFCSLGLALAFVSLLGVLLKDALLLASAAPILLFKVLQAVLLVDSMKTSMSGLLLAATLVVQHDDTKAVLDWVSGLLGN
jgi:hypothetical protein